MNQNERLLRVVAAAVENVLEGAREGMREDIRHPSGEFPYHNPGDLKAMIGRVYVHKKSDGFWSLVDNYEQSPAILELSPDGQWTIRAMYSEKAPKPITQERAEANASMMFYDVSVKRVSDRAIAIAKSILARA